jgi:RND family efflux transporter MFP subunit
LTTWLTTVLVTALAAHAASAAPGAPVPATAVVPAAAAMTAPAPESERGSIARGVVRAVGEATISSRLAARITELPLREGQSFQRGDLLVGFDCERPQAEARAAAAAVDVQTKLLETNEELDKFNAIGKNELLISRSQLDKARAERQAMDSQVKECRLTAPFSGRVMERMARAFEAVQVSQPLLRIADTSALELELIVPSVWLAWLKPGSAFQFRLDETGRALPATVQRLGAAVDPVSKTLRIVGNFRGGNDMVLPGMSGTAAFPQAGR